MLRRLSLSENLFPVQAFFNAIPDERFLGVLQYFAKGIGAGFDEVTCEFAGESTDEIFEGVKFWIFDEEVTLSNADFLKYLNLACASQVQAYPEQGGEITAFLRKIERFLTN